MAAVDKNLPVQVRAFCQEKGLPGAGTRGRISQGAYLAYFKAKPKKVKDIAKAQGMVIPASPRGARAEALSGLAASLVGAGPRTEA